MDPANSTTASTAADAAPAAETVDGAPAEQVAEQTTTDTSDGAPNGLKSALEAERRIARESKAEAARLREQLQAIENEKLSETEKLQKAHDEYKARVEELETAHAKTSAETAFSAAAKAAGAVDESAVAALLIANGATYDPENDNSSDLIEGLKAKHPALFAAVAAPAEQTPGMGAQDAGNGGRPKTFTKAQIDAMTDAEYEANRDQILASLAAKS